MANRWRKTETVTDFIFLGSRITADSDCNCEIKTLALWKKSYNKLRQHIKKQRHHFASKGPYNQSHDFGAQENKVCHSFHFYPFICHEVMGPDAMISILNVEF